MREEKKEKGGESSPRRGKKCMRGEAEGKKRAPQPYGNGHLLAETKSNRGAESFSLESAHGAEAVREENDRTLECGRDLEAVQIADVWKGVRGGRLGS